LRKKSTKRSPNIVQNDKEIQSAVEAGALQKLLSHHFTRRLVVTEGEKSRVAELAVLRPLDEADLNDDLGTDPVGAQAREADGFGEGWFWNLEFVELGAEIEQQLCVKAGANLAGVDKLLHRGALPHGRATAPMRTRTSALPGRPTRYRRWY
jgi:hypothetical protein